MSTRWSMIALGEVLTQYKDYISEPKAQIYPKLSVKLYGKGVVLDTPVNGSTLKMKQHQIAKSGQVILSEIWGKKGAIGFVPPEGDGGLCTSHFFLFDLRREKLEPKYLQALFTANYLQEQLDAEARGTTGYAAVRPKNLLAAKIPLPPLEEQSRIVARIEEISTKIEKARELRKQAVEERKNLISSVLSSVFSISTEKKDTINILRDFVVDDCYGTSSKTSDDFTGVPILRMGNIQSGKLITTDLKYLHLNVQERSKLILRKGDILVNRTNSAELVGKCAVFDLDGEYGFASYIIRLRLDTKRANPYLVALYINSPLGRAYMFNERKQMTGQANVNATKLKSLPISLPSISRQQEIVSFLNFLNSKVDALSIQQDKVDKELNALLSSVLDQAFKGELF